MSIQKSWPMNHIVLLEFIFIISDNNAPNVISQKAKKRCYFIFVYGICEAVD